MYKFFILIIFLLESNNLYANSFNISQFNQNYTKINILNNDNVRIAFHGLLESDSLFINTEVDFIEKNSSLLKQINKVEIILWQYKDSKNISFSNANKTDCKINISYKTPLESFLLKDIKKDIFLITTHEIAHCILNKDIFLNFSKNIKWQYKLTKEEENSINEIIDKKINKSLINNKIVTPHPLIIYHEIFADVFSTLWLYNNNQINIKDIEQLILRRELLYNIDKNYNSMDALREIVQRINKNQLNENTFEDIYKNSLLISQFSFIKYLVNENE